MKLTWWRHRLAWFNSQKAIFLCFLRICWCFYFLWLIKVQHHILYSIVSLVLVSKLKKIDDFKFWEVTTSVIQFSSFVNTSLKRDWFFFHWKYESFSDTISEAFVRRYLLHSTSMRLFLFLRKIFGENLLWIYQT